MSQLPRNFGNYTLLKLLAKGGMGEIYLARSGGISNFEKFYAIKKLLKKFARDRDVTARFIDEAKLGARLQHPNIVQVYDLGAVGEEMFMATEFVDGFDLRRVLRFCHEKKKRIPLDIALFIVREILSGLAYAHRQVDAEGKSINLIHRDISPQNVLVSFEGEVKIIDFGLAKSTQRSQETQANVLLGNFGYMSPEQARGHVLDVRTDVYSTGIVLFELVTGTKRFVDENPLRLLEMVARPTPIMPSDRMPDIPRAIDRIYREAAAPDKDQRLATAEDFRDQVTTALHRLNPRATREHLAQFLNHLFLGGAAPPAVDNDLLNKSVAIQLHDIVAHTEAFQSTKKDDVSNRGLTTGFEEDAAQTNGHELMRSARVGDSLTHQELTGQAAGPAFGGAPAQVTPAPAQVAATPVAPTPVAPAQVDATPVAPTPAPAPVAPTPVAPTPAPAPVAPTPAPRAQPAPPPQPVASAAPPAEVQATPVEPTIQGEPQFVTLADLADDGPAEAEPLELEEGPLAAAVVSVPPEARDPREMPPQALSLDDDDDFEVLEPLDEDDPTVVGHDAPVMAEPLSDLSLEPLAGDPDPDALAAAQAFGDPVASSAEVQSLTSAPTSVYEAPAWSGEPTPASPVTSKLETISSPTPAPRPLPKPGGVVSSSLGPPESPARAAPPRKPEPTVVVDFDSLPGAEVIEPKNDFAEGSGESLIIDFDASDDDETEQMPPAPVAPTIADAPAPRPAARPSGPQPLGPPGGPKIRPAAQPRGKMATGKVVRPNRRGRDE